MQRVDLKKVLEMLVNEEQGNAENLLHQWFVDKTKSIHESLMQEDDDVLDEDATKDIKDDEDSIEAEEYYGDGDLSEDEEDDHHIDSLAAADVQDGSEDLDVSDFDNDDGSEDDLDGDLDDESEPDEEGEQTIAGLADEVEGLQSELQRLKSEFAKIQGGEDEDSDEENLDSEGDEAGDHEEPDGDEDEEGNEPGEEGSEEDEVEESYNDLSEAKKGKKGLPPWLKKGGKKGKEDDKEDDKKTTKKSPKKGEQPPWLKKGKKKVEESDDFDFLDLEEDYKLENVPAANLSGTKEIGSGGSLKVNNDSPIPQKKPDQRVGGSAVEIKSGTRPNGYNRETPPKVATPLIKSPKNEKQELKAVPKDGNSSATLNKKGDGFGSDSPKSPIGAGATDLRGNALKRK